MKFRSLMMIFVLLLLNKTVLAEQWSATISWAGLRNLGLPLSGVIQTVNVTPGSYIDKGKTLLTLECGLYQAELKYSTALVKGFEPAVEKALKDKELADELYARTVLSEVEHRTAELLYIETESKYQAIVAEAEQKKWNTDHCKLTADKDLIVLDLHVKKGEVIDLQSSKPVLVTVADRHLMMASAVVTLPLKKELTPGQQLKVEVSGKTYDARLFSVKYTEDGTATVSAVFEVFEPQYISSKNAKLITE